MLKLNKLNTIVSHETKNSDSIYRGLKYTPLFQKDYVCLRQYRQRDDLWIK